MNPVPLFLIIVTLPLLLGGCREKKVVTEVRNGLMYIKGSENLYTGEQLLFYENGQMEQRANYKDGKFDGLGTSWHENGEKKEQGERAGADGPTFRLGYKTSQGLLEILNGLLFFCRNSQKHKKMDKL